MVGFVFHNEQDRVVANYKDAWESISHAWGLDPPLMIDLTGEYAGRNFPRCYESLQELLNAHPGHQIFYLCLKGSTPQGMDEVLLHKLVHPKEDVLYVVGPNYLETDTDAFERQKCSALQVDIAAALWSLDCGTAVAYDRWLKERMAI